MESLGSWITSGGNKPFYARKSFFVKEAVCSAIVRVCGLGQFALYLNNEKVGDHELDPAWTNYEKRIEYVEFDITGQLTPGENCIGAEVGNGWFIMEKEHYTFQFPPFMPPNPNPYKPFGESLVLALCVEIVYESGARESFCADDTFEISTHPVVMSNVYGSETIDGRRVQKDWCKAGFTKGTWSRAQIVPENKAPVGKLFKQDHPAVKVVHTYEGNYLKSVRLFDGQVRRIYDFSQNMSGILDVEVKGRRGDEIRFYPAEKLDAYGNVDQYAKNWIMVDTCITYIIGQDDVWEHVRMHFTYFAGRYIAVEGQAELRNLRGDAISSAYRQAGEFSCDNPKYEQIYRLVERAVEANMLGVHTDCPQIERFAWQEPNHLMAPSIFYMKDGQKLWKKFFADMRAQQHTAQDYFYDFDGHKFFPGEGLIPSQCPCYIPNVLPVPGMGSFYDIIAWGSAGILGVYWHYMFYGDSKVIEDNYDSGKRYYNHLKGQLTPEGFINHGIGDWGNPKNELARENVETAFLYADAVVLADFAHILEKEDDEKWFRKEAKAIQENYNARLLVRHPKYGYYCYKAWDHPEDFYTTQACQALPLYWGIVPEEYAEDVAKALGELLDHDGAFVSGEVGLPYIIQCARKYNMNDKISRFILKEEHPSYYAFVLDGETTLGEYWEKNPRSHCHDMMGHIIEWYYNGIAGIRPMTPGFKSVAICPWLPQDMHHFRCVYHSVSGTITVEVAEYADYIDLKVICPADMSCQVDTLGLGRFGKNVFYTKESF